MTTENVLNQDQADEQLAPATQDTSQHDDVKPLDIQEPSNDRPVVQDNPDWREVRHIMKDQRSKIESLEKELNQFKSPVKQEQDPLETLAEDDVVTVADMKRYAAKVAKQTAQEIFEQKSLQQQFDSTPNKYSDYFDVMKYVEPLIKENPVLLHSIENSPNPREAAYAIAKMYMKASNPGQASAKKIEQNLSKPKSADSLSLGSGISSELGHRELSLEERTKMFEESQRYASMR